jgi:hypothetical protein
MFSCLKTYLSIFALMIGSSLLAQLSPLHPILSSYSISETNGQVYISCTISAGNTCNGIEVLRSTDSLNFKVVGGVDGVCGSLTEPVAYDFSDKKPPKNQKVYYKLELGRVGFTNVKSVVIPFLTNSGYNIYPNPSNNSLRIDFNNDVSSRYNLIIYNRKGTELINLQTNQDYFKVETSQLSTGFYSFLIQSTVDNQKFTGKFVVEH